MTGLSRDVAAFQAQSAFSGVGFTTSESEYVVSHPVRRRIIRFLMLLGSAGLTSAMATLVLTFVGNTPTEMMYNGVWMGAGLVALYIFGKSKLVDKGLSRFIEAALTKWTHLRVFDYEMLLGLSKGYSISLVKVKPGSWLEGRTLRELRLRDEGVLVLAVYKRSGKEEVYLGVPSLDLRLEAGDTLVCYGPSEVLSNLPERIKGVKGELEHARAMAKQALREQEERADEERLMREGKHRN
ncbi:MAG: TrkA C-terminal domain-containing protein [Desulfurococcales archaeon]|nr:TrkA C-terminal domain-containing protein [Desulfurococcales archaeon]